MSGLPAIDLADIDIQHAISQAIFFNNSWCSKKGTAQVATHRGAQQHHFGITGCGTGAGGFYTPLWHPVEQQEEESPCTQHPEAHQGQPPTAQTVALQLLYRGGILD